VRELAGRVVMVAGGAGLVGSAIVRELLNKGSTVVCYDNYLHGHPAHVAGLSGPFTAIHGDVRDNWSLFKALRDHNVEYIIDCVGDTFVPTAYIMPEWFSDINVGGTLHLLRAADALSIKRMVYVSSTEVYGEAEQPKCDEETPLNPVNTYAVSKAVADRLCHTYYLEHGVPVVIARIFNGRAKPSLTFVHDAANALISVLASDVPDGDVVNVGSDTSYSVEWLAHRLAEIIEVNSLEIITDPARLRRKDIDRFRCDDRKLLKYTNWKPTVGIDQGLKMTVEWFRKNGARRSWESFVDGTAIYR
jgi:nucleoside-diphosphate-sugar epimerase